ncbi:DUF6056 family protein [Eisenbergiella tayi]|uniref:DUF6056 family protein n=1 Tax=Eisenbergiella tayi TaxID=1432052 RepID=UPI00114D1E14|nr:DUF6056 family protein [Eisenbergiella tayi]
MKKILGKLDNKKIAILTVFLFLISMFPIWYLSEFARPSGDDFGYSVLTHRAWLESHSLLQVFKAAFQTVKHYYTGWNGDWFTTFLFSLMPEVFVPYSFWIIPIIMTLMLIISTTIFMHEFCVNIFHIPFSDFIIFDMLLLIISYQFIPSTAVGMYWYVGSVHYILPHAAALTGIVCGSKYIRTNKKKFLLGIILCMLPVGGGSYFSSLLVFIVGAATLLLLLNKKNKKALWIILPLLVCGICFIIQCLSPGNSVRGGESFGFHWGVVFATVINSLKRSVMMIGVYLREKTFLFVVMLIIAVFGLESMSKCRGNFQFRRPILFLGFMFGCYSAMFAPELYSELYSTIEISLGPATVQYLVFLLTMAGGILYIEGWLVQTFANKVKVPLIIKENYRLYIIFPCIIFSAFLTIFNRGWFVNCVDKRVMDYVVSGQAEDFKKQISSQMEILLDDTIKDAYLVPINPDQGPLMHMPVTEDPEAFTNRVVRDFYGKNMVTMISAGEN